MSTVNLPEGLQSGGDWSSTLQKIVAYGAGRVFDSQAVERIYKSNPTPVSYDGEDFYTSGQVVGNKTSGGNIGMNINPLFLLLGLGVLVFALRD